MDYNYPYRIGVTGHKSLTEVEKLYISKELNRVITTIQRTIDTRRKAAGIGSDFFITGLTSLAEGADRVFAAEIANAGGTLEVVLPFRKGIYIQDFWGDESKANFLSMLSFDNCPIVVDNSAQPHKELAYYNAAKIIVDQCDVLIAVWDETPLKTKTSTEGIIDYAKQKGVPTIVLYTKPSKDSEKENKESLEGISLEGYRKFDKEWKPLIKQFEADKAPVLNSESIKTVFSDEDQARFGLLYNAYRIWNAAALKSALQASRPVKRALVWVAVAALAGILGYVADHFELVKAGLTQPWLDVMRVTPAQMDKARPLFHLSWRLFDGLEVFSMLVVFIIFLKTFTGTPQKKRWVQSRLWAEKMKLQIYKLTVLQAGGEMMDENYGEEMLRSRSLDSRLFMVLSKEVWNAFKNPLSLEQRTAVLTDEFIKGAITEADHRFKEQKLLFNRLNGFNALLIVISLISAGLLFANHMIEIRFAFPLVVLQGLALLAPLAALFVQGWAAAVYSDRLVNNAGNLQSRLTELSTLFPELCTNEDDLQVIFNKAASMMLQENSEWKLLASHPEWKK